MRSGAVITRTRARMSSSSTRWAAVSPCMPRRSVEVGDGAAGLLEHVGHATGDIGGAGVLANLLALGIKVVEDLLAAFDSNAAAPSPRNAPLTSLIEFITC